MSGPAASSAVLSSKPSPCPARPSCPCSQLVPPEWNGLAARIYSLNLARTAVCGDLPDSLASAIGPAQRRDTGLGQPCPWQADADVLLRFREVLADPLRALGSWEWHSSPCGVPGWRGVACAGGRVAGVNLTRAGLSGGRGWVAWSCVL